MALTYNQPNRDLDIKGRITTVTGRVISLTAADVMEYSVAEQCALSGFALGEAAAASYVMDIADPAHKYSAVELNGALVEMQIGILNGGEYNYSDFGKWNINRPVVSRQNSTLSLSGSDYLETHFNAKYEDADGNYPRTIGALAADICQKANVTLASTTFLNSAVTINKKPVWPDGTTLRGVIGYIAAVAGGFARMNRSGNLEFVTLSSAASSGVIDPYTFKTAESGAGVEFYFNCLAVRNEGEEEYTRYAVSGYADSASNTLQVDANPLYTQAIAEAVKTALTGFRSYALTVEWVGDPGVLPGTILTLEDTDGLQRDFVVTAQDVRFAGGLSASTRTELAEETGSSSGYYVSDGVVGANGGLNSNKVVSAVNGYIENLNAQTINTNTLVASIAHMLRLVVDQIDAGTITADSLTAAIIDAIDVRASSITADTINTDKFAAAIAKIVQLKVEQIDADNISTDTLAAVLGEFVKLYSETAGFDFATIKDLQAGTAIIEKGVNGKLYVADLAVTEANMVSLTVGELIVKGADGRFYTIGIDADGNVTTTIKQVENDDVGDLSINAGEKLIEGSVTAKTLNAQEIFADSALIRELIAANLDVGTLFAREATIAQLNAIDISGNEFLRLMAREEIRFEVDPLKSAVDAVQQTADDANATAANVRTWMTFDTDGLKQGKSGSNYSTLIDDVGFHILQKDEKISSFAKRQLAVEEVRVGKVDTTQTRCVLREAGDGGMIITVEGLT